MIRRRDLLLASAALPLLSGKWFSQTAFAQGGPENSITIRDSSGEGANNCPLRIGRPFVRGEIHDAPQAFIDGKPIPTQADIKTRWPDGSVNHAILSFIIPRLRGGDPLKITFANGPVVPGQALDAAQMLAPRFNFEAQIAITRDSKTETASARAMLQNGNFVSWCKGPIATTIILADHSTDRKYDFGFETSRPIRPIFHATFWPSISKVFVRAIAENSNSEALQDVLYDVRLTAGQQSSLEVFEQGSVCHSAGTRWTRRFWIGDNPTPPLDVHHNIAYLAASLAFPNFDPSLEIPEHVLAETYAWWIARPRNLYGRGGWMKGMDSSGGRDDIGPYTGFEARWLLSGDHRAYEVVATQADLAGAWPLQVREGNAQKRYDRAGKVPALGRPLSIFARPRLWLFDPRDHSEPQDKVLVRLPRIVTPGEGWSTDTAHPPDPYSALYTLTGDYFALEQLQLWVSSWALAYDPGYKGPAPSGAILGQVRGNAWNLRDRANAAFLSPDGSPEKEYFRTLIDDAVAFWEGEHNIHGTRFDGTPLWTFARKNRPQDNPLHFFVENRWLNEKGINVQSQLWQNYMLIFELGRAKELGFPTAALLSWSAKLLTGQFAEPETYSPYNILRYQTRLADQEGNYYKTWTETLKGYPDPTIPANIGQDACDGYVVYAYGASTMTVHEPGGAAAYEWLSKNVYERLKSRIAACPKWAYLPRP